ncbi:hypothetical protein M513_13514, partial [Trichuris suis]
MHCLSHKGWEDSPRKSEMAYGFWSMRRSACCSNYQAFKSEFRRVAQVQPASRWNQSKQQRGRYTDATWTSASRHTPTQRPWQTTKKENQADRRNDSKDVVTVSFEEPRNYSGFH